MYFCVHPLFLPVVVTMMINIPYSRVKGLFIFKGGFSVLMMMENKLSQNHIGTCSEC